MHHMLHIIRLTIMTASLHHVDGAGGASSTLLEQLIYTVLSTTGTTYSPLTFTYTATQQTGANASCPVCLTPIAGPSLLWSFTEATVAVGSLELPAASDGSTSTSAEQTAMLTLSGAPCFNFPSGEALSILCECDAVSATAADCTFDSTTMLRFGDYLNPAFWFRSGVVPIRTSIITIVAAAAEATDRLLNVASVTAAVLSGLTQSAADATFNATASVIEAEIQQIVSLALVPAVQRFNTAAAALLNMSLNSPDCAVAAAANSNNILSNTGNVPPSAVLEVVAAAVEDATRFWSSAISYTDSIDSRAQLVSFHRRYMCAAATFSVGQLMLTLSNITAIAVPTALENWELTAALFEGNSLASLQPPFPTLSQLLPSTDLPVPSFLASYVSCMSDWVSPWSLSGIPSPSLAEDTSSKCLFAAVGPTVLSVLTPLRVSESSPTTDSIDTVLALAAASVLLTVDFNRSIPNASELVFHMMGTTWTTSSTLTLPGSQAPLVYTFAVFDASSNSAATLGAPNLQTNGVYLANVSAADALPSWLSEPYPAPSMPSFFPADGINCPPGTYRTRDPASGAFTCTQCRTEAPQFAFCPGDNLMHLCYDAPVVGAAYLPQPPGFTGPNCPFVCVSPLEYRASETTCAPASVGSAPVNGSSALMTCAVPSVISLFAPSPLQFISGGVRGLNASCSVNLLFRVAAPTTVGAVVESLCRPQLDANLISRAGLNVNVQAAAFTAPAVSTCYGLVAILPAPSNNLEGALELGWGFHASLIYDDTNNWWTLSIAFVNTTVSVVSDPFALPTSTVLGLAISLDWYSQAASFFVNGARVGGLVSFNADVIVNGAFCLTSLHSSVNAVIIAGGIASTRCTILPTSSLHSVSVAGGPLPSAAVALDATGAWPALGNTALSTLQASLSLSALGLSTACGWGYYGTSASSCVLCPSSFAGSVPPRSTIADCTCLPGFVRQPSTNESCVIGLPAPPTPTVVYREVASPSLRAFLAGTLSANPLWQSVLPEGTSPDLIVTPTLQPTIAVQFCVPLTDENTTDVQLIPTPLPCSTVAGLPLTPDDRAAFAASLLGYSSSLTNNGSQLCASFVPPAVEMALWPLPIVCSIGVAARGSWMRLADSTSDTLSIVILPMALPLASSDVSPIPGTDVNQISAVANTLGLELELDGYPLHPIVPMVTHSNGYSPLLIDVISTMFVATQLQCAVCSFEQLPALGLSATLSQAGTATAVQTQAGPASLQLNFTVSSLGGVSAVAAQCNALIPGWLVESAPALSWYSVPGHAGFASTESQAPPDEFFGSPITIAVTVLLFATAWIIAIIMLLMRNKRSLNIHCHAPSDQSTDDADEQNDNTQIEMSSMTRSPAAHPAAASTSSRGSVSHRTQDRKHVSIDSPSSSQRSRSSPQVRARHVDAVGERMCRSPTPLTVDLSSHNRSFAARRCPSPQRVTSHQGDWVTPPRYCVTPLRRDVAPRSSLRPINFDARQSWAAPYDVSDAVLRRTIETNQTSRRALPSSPRFSSLAERSANETFFGA